MHLPFASGYFCRSIGVRARRNTSQKNAWIYLEKICPKNMPYNGGPYGIKVGQDQGISTGNTAHGPKNMAYKPPFYAFEPFLLGVGVVFNLLRDKNTYTNGGQQKFLPFQAKAWLWPACLDDLNELRPPWRQQCLYLGGSFVRTTFLGWSPAILHVCLLERCIRQ